MSVVIHLKESPQHNAWRHHIHSRPRRGPPTFEQYTAERSFWTKHRLHSKSRRFVEVPRGRGFEDWESWVKRGGPERDFHKEKAWWMERKSTTERIGGEAGSNPLCCVVS